MRFDKVVVLGEDLMTLRLINKSGESSVGIALGCGLDDYVPSSEFRTEPEYKDS
jgi:hypothetical protein